MGSGIYVATAGAVAQSTALDVTANNIANASTTGFQAARISFSEALAKAKSPDVALVSNSTREIVDGQPGELMTTGNPLDVALHGDGYLSMNTANGVRYTRAGSLQRDPTGLLVSGDGNQIRGQAGSPIVLPEGTSQVTIGEDGAVLADGVEVGKLELSRFAPGALSRDGNATYVARKPPVDGEPPQVIQGSLEGSNVNVVRGVVDLVKVSRTYETLLRLIEGYSSVESRAARDLGGPK